MQSTVQELIEASQQLSSVEQLQLLTALTELVYYSSLQPSEDALSRATLHAINRTSPVSDIDSFMADFWPVEETADDLNDFIYQQRHAERTADL